MKEWLIEVAPENEPGAIAPSHEGGRLVQRGISLKPLMAGVLLFPLPLRFMFIQRNGEHRP